MKSKLIFLSAFLSGMAFPGNQLGLLSLISFIPLFYVLYHSSEESYWRIATYAFKFSFVYCLVSMYWIGYSNPPGLFGMAFTVMARYALTFLLFKFVRRTSKQFYLIVPLLMLNEYFSAFTELDYTWHFIGYALTDFPILIQIAEYTGIHGLSAVIFICNYLIFKAFIERSNKSVVKTYAVRLTVFLGFFMCCNLLIFYQYDRSGATAIKVGVLQPNVDAFMKWNPKYKHISVNRLFEGTNKVLDEGADHVVFPETAYPFYLRLNYARKIVDSLQFLSDTYNATFAVGVIDRIQSDENKTRFYNSVFHFKPSDSRFETYYKQKLVPVAEKDIYPELLGFFGELPGAGGFDKGTESTVFSSIHKRFDLEFSNNRWEALTPDRFKKDSLTFATVICIESTFPSLISEFKENGAEWLNIITNDGWFFPHYEWFRALGKDWGFSVYWPSKGAYQHQKIALVRAVENRMSIVRSANTGVSSIIDPFGYTIEETPQYERKTLVNYVPILKANLTFFNRNGHWVIGLATLVFLLGSIPLRFFVSKN